MKIEDENSRQGRKEKKKQETKLVFSTKLVFFTGVSYPVLDLPYLVLFHCWLIYFIKSKKALSE
jgi:hypothetical protein